MNLLVIVLEGIKQHSLSPPLLHKNVFTVKKNNTHYQEHVIIPGIWFCSSCWSKFISLLSTVKKGTLCKCEIKNKEIRNIFVI